MPLPSVSNIAVPVAIQNLTIQYKPRNLIQEQVFPIVPVPSPQVKVLKYGKSMMFSLQDGDLSRVEGTDTKRFSYDVTTQTIAPKQISAEALVTDELLDVSNMPGQMPLQPIIDAVQLAVAKIDNYKELAVARAIYQTSTAWADGSAYSSVNKSAGVLPNGSVGSPTAGTWGLATTSNSFINDVFAAKDSVRKNTGIIPNKLIIDYSTFVAQQINPNLSDKIKYTQKGVITADLLASVLELDEVLIGRSIYNAANDNVAATARGFTGTSIWNPSGKGNAFLFYQEAPGLRAMAAGFQFRLPYMGSMRYIRGYRDERVRSTVYQITEQVEIAPVAFDVGYAWYRTIS